jgi:hypothetical protein
MSDCKRDFSANSELYDAHWPKNYPTAETNIQNSKMITRLTRIFYNGFKEDLPPFTFHTVDQH